MRSYKSDQLNSTSYNTSVGIPFICKKGTFTATQVSLGKSEIASSQKKKRRQKSFNCHKLDNVLSLSWIVSHILMVASSESNFYNGSYAKKHKKGLLNVQFDSALYCNLGTKGTRFLNFHLKIHVSKELIDTWVLYSVLDHVHWQESIVMLCATTRWIKAKLIMEW